ncbi:MAG TPA: sigma-70 family RNA polymerase sigma factor [Acidimicrobiales bacterium]|nr:sigma-70 family RNA polymerase sigma factor [Acidimicrobiales bacterium]
MTLPPFQRFLDDHAADVHRFLVSAAGRDDADDCFQETFLAALRAWPDLRTDDNLRGWVFTIAARKAADAHRARGRRPVPSDAVPVREAAPTELGDDELWDRVRELPPKQRTAVVLRYVVDLTHADIADALGSSEEAARRNVHEGLKKLKGALA